MVSAKWIAVVTLMPEMVTDVLAHGVVGKAVSDGLIEVNTDSSSYVGAMKV